MSSLIQGNYAAVLVAGFVAAVILFTICIIKRFVRLAIGIAVLSIIIPVLFTIFWGDGTTYISELASYLAPKYQQQLQDAYAYYKKKDSEDPVIHSDAVSDKITDVFSAVKEKEFQITDDAAEISPQLKMGTSDRRIPGSFVF